MKIISSLLLIMAVSLALRAQQNVIIMYGYDLAGNRISREAIFINAKMDNSNDSIADPIVKGGQEETLSEDEPLQARAIESTLDGASVKIYPNPVTETLIVSVDKFAADYNAEIFVYDMNGKLLQKQANSSRYAPISFLDYSTGTYILKIRVNEEQKEWLIVKK